MGKNISKEIPTINLVKSKKVNILDKVIGWALSIGRLLVIITEIVAFSAFLYRFDLDRQLIDLHDEIKRKQRIIVLYEQNEQKFRDLQNRLAVAKQFSIEGVTITKLYKNIYSLAQNTVTIKNMNITGDHIQLELNAPSVSSLSTFINGLNKNEFVTSISINKIDNKTSSATLVVNVSAILKQKIDTGE